MKKLLLTMAIAAGVGLLGVSFLTHAQERPSAKFEYATVKWDGPDRLFISLPDRFELKHLSEYGIKIPKEAQAEEFCLAAACNIMARTGWEPVNLNSRRVLYRRPAGSTE